MASDPVSRGRRAAFLDRDGVINVDHGYVFRREDFEFVDGVLEASATLAGRGFALVVVTNQSGIGRGLYSEDDFAALTAWMSERFEAAGAALAGVYHCPHHPVEARDAYRIECDCRKPAPGMLLQAARELTIDLERSALFGDKRHDLEAAAAAGVPARILLGTNGERLPAAIEASLCSARFRSLADAVSSAGLWNLLGETSHA
ncbi:MAG TPA: D-glycero-beta-D-manno-heptose 1,7-bisphosphate 7-phosphatase [Burkholderiaceae bacterium]|nr:D-glycero-beta-D-manno-heptose 1,7-bisphosphate 7-phosphatase [Burkholderiaceae bacterium]